jgi:succinyl-diaminopimelate desuccinylase
MSAKATADELATRTLELCRIQSPIGQERAIADHLEQWAKGHFAAGEVFRHSHSLVLGSLNDSRPTVALIGHVDTVPAHTSDEPPKLSGGRVVGLGSSDMKGGLAVMQLLAERLDRKALPYNLLFILYEREEGPYAENGLGPLVEKCPALTKVRFGIAMEPTDSKVQVGCVGSIHATLRFTGRRAHSARPWQGENAIHQAGALLGELHTLGRRSVKVGGFEFFEVFSITRAQGGHARNVVPDAFELNLNYRFAPGKTLDEAKRDVEKLIAGRAQVEFTDLSPSGRVCSDNPLYQKLLQVTGLPAESKQAWTDVARFSELGVDAVNFGPGETAQAHQANESAPVDALRVAYEKLSGFLTAS